MSQGAVIFDMDGLLVDTEPLQFAAYEQVLRERYGVALSSEITASLVGRRSDEIWARLRALYGLSESIEVLGAAHVAQYEPLLRRYARPMPGAQSLISALHRHGYLLAIASSSPLWQIRIICDLLQLDHLLAAMASGEEVAHGKPAPDVYLLATARLGLPPQRCVALEDSEPGTTAAKAAGMFVIAVPSAATTGQSFVHADVVRSSLLDVEPDIVRLLGDPGRQSHVPDRSPEPPPDASPLPPC